MTINKTNTNKNTVELRTELSANGIAMENVYVNGRKFCCVGYGSEHGKEACLHAIQTAIDTSENEYEAAMKLMTIANFGDKEVSPDKEMEVCGIKVFISYKDKTAYDANGNELADCKELTCELPDEAIEAILLPRIEKVLEEDEGWE